MSISFLAIGFILCLGFFALLLPPLIRGARADGGSSGERAFGSDGHRQDERAQALRARLAGIESERVSGLLTEAAAAEAVIEAQRAALADTPETPPTLDTPGSARTDPDTNLATTTAAARAWRMAAVLFVALSPAIVAFLYPMIGAPSVQPIAWAPNTPDGALANRGANAPGSAPQTVAQSNQTVDPAAAIAAMPPRDRQVAIANMVDGLAARLADTPDDIAGWRMLARSQMVLGRPSASADSWRRVLALTDGDREDWMGFANARIAIGDAGGNAGGDPSAFPTDAEFISILDALESRRPGDPFAQFYRAGALQASGDPLAAAALWEDLLNKLPADAPIRDALRRLIDQARAMGEETE